MFGSGGLGLGVGGVGGSGTSALVQVCSRVLRCHFYVWTLIDARIVHREFLMPATDNDAGETGVTDASSSSSSSSSPPSTPPSRDNPDDAAVIVRRPYGLVRVASPKSSSSAQQHQQQRKETTGGSSSGKEPTASALEAYFQRSTRALLLSERHAMGFSGALKRLDLLYAQRPLGGRVLDGYPRKWTSRRCRRRRRHRRVRRGGRRGRPPPRHSAVDALEMEILAACAHAHSSSAGPGGAGGIGSGGSGGGGGGVIGGGGSDRCERSSRSTAWTRATSVACASVKWPSCARPVTNSSSTTRKNTTAMLTPTASDAAISDGGDGGGDNDGTAIVRRPYGLTRGKVSQEKGFRATLLSRSRGRHSQHGTGGGGNVATISTPRSGDGVRNILSDRLGLAVSPEVGELTLAPFVSRPLLYRWIGPRILAEVTKLTDRLMDQYLPLRRPAADSRTASTAVAVAALFFRGRGSTWRACVRGAAVQRRSPRCRPPSCRRSTRSSWATAHAPALP